MKKLLIPLLALSLLFIISLPFTQLVLAADIKLQVNLGQGDTVSNLETYIKWWYNLVIGSIGVLAAVYIVWGGFKWLTAAGNSGVISDAKLTITMAIIGLLIAIFSYSLLYILNPNLTILKTPTTLTTSN